MKHISAIILLLDVRQLHHASVIRHDDKVVNQSLYPPKVNHMITYSTVMVEKAHDSMRDDKQSKTRVDLAGVAYPTLV